MLLFLPRVRKPSGRSKAAHGTLMCIVLPALAMLPLYATVFVDKRYMAGALLIIALVLLLTVLPKLRSQHALRFCYITSLATCIWFLLLPSLLGIWSLTRSVAGLAETNPDRQQAIADEIRGLGLRPADRIAYIGLGIRAYWPSLVGAHIVAEIPVPAVRTGRHWNNQDIDDTEDVDLFWHSSRERQDEILALFRRSGARAVVSDYVPAGADTSGWIKLKACIFWRRRGMDLSEEVYRHEVYVRFL
jgi:hypothetical protein